MLFQELEFGKFFIDDSKVEYPYDRTEIFYRKTGPNVGRRFDGTLETFDDFDYVSPVKDCYTVDTVKNPSRRQWFDIFAARFGGEVEKVATVKSVGLVLFLLDKLAEIYDYIEIR